MTSIRRLHRRYLRWRRYTARIVGVEPYGAERAEQAWQQARHRRRLLVCACGSCVRWRAQQASGVRPDTITISGRG